MSVCPPRVAVLGGFHRHPPPYTPHPIPPVAPGGCCNGTGCIYGANPPPPPLPGQRFPFTTWFGRDAAFFHPYTGCSRLRDQMGHGTPRGAWRGGRDTFAKPAAKPQPLFSSRLDDNPPTPARWVGDTAEALEMMGPHRGAPIPRKPGCCPSRGAGSYRTRIRVRLCRGRPADAPPQAPLAAVPGGRWGGMPAGRIVFHHLVGLVGGSCAGRADGSGSCGSAAIYGVGKKNGAKKDKKQPCERAGRTPPFAAPYAHSCAPLRLAGFHPSAGRDLRHWATGLSRALGAGGGWKQGRAKGVAGSSPPLLQTQRRSQGHTRRDVPGLREVRAGCPAQPRIPEGWKPAWGQGLGWGLQPKPSCCSPPGVGLSAQEQKPRSPSQGSRTLQSWGQGAPWSQSRPQTLPALARAGWTLSSSVCCGASLGTKITPPAPPGFQAMPSLAVQPRADYTAERPRLPAGMLLSVILVIVSRNHRHAAPRDPWRLRRGVPGGGSPTGTPHQTHRLQDGEPRGVFLQYNSFGVKKHSFFAFSAPWHGQCPQLSSVMGRWEAGAGARIPLGPPRLWASDGVRWVPAVGFWGG